MSTIKPGVADESMRPRPRAVGDARAGADWGRRSARAGAVATAGQAAQLLLTLGAMVLLARLLEPADFGVIAMAMTLVSFVGVVRDLGLPGSVIYQHQPTHDQVSTLFWLSVAFASALAIGVALSGPLLATLYSEPRLVWLMPVPAVAVAVISLGAQHEALLKRELGFERLAMVNLAGTAAAVTTSVALAIGGAGYWALAVHPPVEAIVAVAGYWLASGWRPGRPRRGAGLWPMLRYGADTTASRVATHLGKHLDRVLLSVYTGPASVGLYAVADRWAAMPAQLLYGRLSGGATAGLTRVRDDAERYRAYYRRSIGLLWSVMLPALAGVALESRPIILVVAGPQWEDAAPLLRWLAVAALAVSVSQTCKWMFLAEGRTRPQLVVGVMAAVASAAAVAIGVAFGVVGVALGFAIANVVMAPIILAVWLRRSPVRWSDVGHAIARPAGATSVMAGVWLVLRNPSGLALLDRFVTTAVLGGAYAVAWIALPGGMPAVRDACATAASMCRPEPDRNA